MLNRWTWKTLPKVKDTNDNHLQEAKNRLNYLNWAITQYKDLYDKVMLSDFEFHNIYTTMTEEKKFLEILINYRKSIE